MTAKRFTIFGEWHKDNVIDEIRDNTGEFVTIGRCVDLLNENEQLRTKNNAYIQDIEVFKEEVTHLKLENEQLKEQNADWETSFDICKQYKQSVSDVLINWSQKNLTAKQLQVIIAIMEELNVIGDDRND